MRDIDALWRMHASAVLTRRPDFRFDPDFYRMQVPSLEPRPAVLLHHYQAHGVIQGLFPTYYSYQRAANTSIDDILADLVIDSDLAAHIETGNPDSWHLACELIRLGSPTDMRVSNFSAHYYQKMYPDIRKAGLDPLTHFLTAGAKEGRLTLSHIRKNQLRGKVGYLPDRPTCLITTHEMSFTGAPIVALELTAEASETHNVLVVALRDGPLRTKFLNSCCELIIAGEGDIHADAYIRSLIKTVEFAVINSVESWPLINFLVSNKIPFTSYIHEYATYTYPAFKKIFVALFSDNIAFSSEHVRESWHGQLLDVESNLDRDTLIIPQRTFQTGGVTRTVFERARQRLSTILGKDLSDVKLVCGAGQLQWRKGPDIFAMTAQISRHIDPKIVFVWIGDGLNAEDVGFGVWMNYHQTQAEANYPQGNLFFLPAGQEYLNVLAASDVMFLSSRLDPLPNVVFDALEAGCRIVQFKEASGFSDPVYRESNRFISVEYGNPKAAADAITEVPSKEFYPSVSKAASAQPFSLIKGALQENLKRRRYHSFGTSQFDVPVLFSSDWKDRDKRILERQKMHSYGRRYVWQDLQEIEEALSCSDCPSLRAMRLIPYGPHRADILPAFSMHIHAFHTDELLSDIRTHRAFGQARRIVVTTDTTDKAKEVDRSIREAGLNAEVVLVPNRGRDILPLMELFHEGGPAGQDDIWCHIHQKKSLDTTRGDGVWRRFLLKILLGDELVISNALTLIADPEVGLVAPVDPYHLGWGRSRELLKRFASRFSFPLPRNPILFPVGNMFWSRRSVILKMNDIFGANYPWPNEPIPTDGTEYHLIERLWPIVAAEVGLRSTFIHKLDEART